MTDNLTTRVDRLTRDVEALKNKGKDGWDKFQIIAALLIPTSIAVVGFMVSKSLKEAEIASAQNLASSQLAVARVNTRVGQANLVKSFMEALLSEEPRKRKLAIEAILIALPEDGHRLVRIVSETDPDTEVRQFAKTLQRVDSLLNLIDHLPDDDVLKLVKNPPVRNEQIERVVALRDPNNLRTSDPNIARQLLKMMLVLAERDDSTLRAWELGMSKLI